MRFLLHMLALILVGGGTNYRPLPENYKRTTNRVASPPPPRKK